ncbi:aspartyl-tRNA(Asn)/glutamyl-tRNA(Gln) amidotransferase subunit A [Mycoplasmopsis mustelae]|uniref:Aspartyl-tRNA(Asn)/glutamyl-tRNA(Gln) amidotransferase subunit A n=1 Tax=Mycoplasmopsis mustelae TaxID=171289 RepID=A0A4R7UCP2_9BACT|nr:amidase family protein [Mycoplasmopsis mustelae]TDV24197.1 aspartyl-tRNA(Asn)/glutamyl-tRNA(Gln) amidotransferase subunit A [Mycoplasmopsis mustelae]
MRQLKNKGNYEKAYYCLKNDANNAVAHMLDYNPDAYVKNQILSGAVLTIKDNYATKNDITSASSLILENFKPGYNATAVEKLLQAGAHPVAKVHLDELALGGTGTYSAYGLIANPIDSNRLVGGSSSGSVATFTKDISIALGSDTGDSVRLPASYNGVVGFKPSYGAISRYGLFAYASSLDTVAYFSHYVNDIILASQAMFGKDNKDMTSKEIAIQNIQKQKPESVLILDFDDLCENYVTEAMQKLEAKLLAENITVHKVRPNLDILNCIKPAYEIISFSEASSNLANLTGVGFGSRVGASHWEELIRETRSQKFGRMVQERLSLGSYFLYAENIEEMFFKAQKVRRVIKDYLTHLQQQADLVLFAAAPSIAPLLKSNKKYGVMDYILTAANLVGNPSLTLPLAKYQNLPFSLTLETEIYQDAKLLAYAEYLEELIGGGCE